MYKYYKPENQLANYIKAVWELEFPGRGEFNVAETLVPSGMPEILFYFGIEENSGISSEYNTPSQILGQRYSPLQIFGPYCSGIISVILQPWVLSLFTRYPAVDFLNRFIPSTDVFPTSIMRVQEAVNKSNDFEQRRDVILGWIEKVLMEKSPYFDKRIKYSIINTNVGSLSVEKTANNVNLSVRQFQRLFKNETGLSPREFNSVIRFQRSIFIKQKYPDISLTQLAYSSGYSDQPHMNHDYKKFSNLAPSEFYSGCTPFSDYFTFL